MKIHPAILILLAVVAYVAVTLFSLSLGPAAAIYTIFWSIAVLAAGIYAAGRTTESSVFARGLLAGVAFALFALFSSVRGIFRLAQKIVGLNFSGDPDVIDSGRLAISLTFGIALGCVALWRHRRQERKAQKT